MLFNVSVAMAIVGVVVGNRIEKHLKQEYFAKEHAKMMAQLDTGLLGELAKVSASVAHKTAYINPTPTVKWKPVQCALLDMELKRVGEIHSGKRNTVDKLKDSVSGKFFAHKTFDGPDEYTAELTMVMMTAEHPYMVKPICILPSKHRPGIVFEFVEGEPSSKYVLNPNVDYKTVQRMSAQLFDAMVYIHYLGYIHGDLKPDNVMMTPQGDIKVIDFGFALQMPYTKGNRGTATTMAPELVKAVSGPIDEATDWWAYGSTVAMWNSLIIARSKTGRYVPCIVSKSADELNKMFKFGSCNVNFPLELKQFLAMFLQLEVEKRRFNKKAEFEFAKNTAYLSSYFK